MILLRQVIGDALRARRQGQHRTLRDVSTAANVSLGYLSEIERGQKEPSSELLASVCDALGARLSEVLREVSNTVALAEQMPDMSVPAGQRVLSPDRESLGAEHAVESDDERARAAGAVREPAALGRPGRTCSSNQADTPVRAVHARRARPVAGETTVSVSVRPDAPLRTTLHGARRIRPASRERDRERDVVCVA